MDPGLAVILSDQVLVGLGASMLATGSYGAVRERLLQGLVYCTDRGYTQLGFPTSEEGGFFERPSNCPALRDDAFVIPGLAHASLVLPCTNGGLQTCSLEIRTIRWQRPKKAE